MGCVQSTPGDKEKVKGQDKLQTSLLAPTLHYSIKYVPQACKITNYKREDIETLYKMILSPFQVKSVPFSNGRFLDPDVPYEPIDGGFDSNFENLQAELLSASKTWPLNTSDSIFVFLNEGKSIRLKALITGAESTPYAHGLFEFDLAFNNYPLLPPKVNFLTTGNNKVTFGPLLCKTGKVRLPILGMTYGCEKEELWTKEKGVSEILFALHELVKTNNLCENELNLETLKVDEDVRRRMNKGCGNVVKCCTIQYAMLYHLRNPAPWLRDFIHTYFYLKKDIILKECHKWLVAAQDDDALYETFGSLYNPELSAKIANGNYHRKLQKLVWNLEKELAKIKIHIDPPFLDSLGPTQNETQTEEEKEDKGDKEDNNQEENKGDSSYKTQMSEF